MAVLSRGRPAGGPAILALVAVACTDLVPGDDLLDAGPAPDAAPLPPGLARPPGPPTTPDGPDGPVRYYALRPLPDVDGVPQAFLDQRRGAAWRSIGWDIDGVLSAGPDPDGSCAPADDGVVAPDGIDGRDNTFGSEFFPVVEAATPDARIEDDIRRMLLEGLGTIVVEISGWSGADDDPSLIMRGVQSYAVDGTGLSTPPVVTLDPDGQPLADGVPSPPAWQGEDWFVPFDGTVFGEDAGFLEDPDAYVSGRTFVARIDQPVDIPFSGFGRGAVLRIVSGLATMSLEGDGRIAVTISGRWSRDQVVLTAERAFCEGSELLDLVVPVFDQFADLLADGSNRPAEPCDAISVALPLIGVPVRPVGGDPLPPPTLVDCP